METVRGLFKVLGVVVALSLTSPVYALWPIPRSLDTGTTPLILAKNFNIVGLRNSPSDLSGAISRTLGHLSNDKLQRLVVGRAAADKAAVQHAKQLSALTLSLSSGVKANSISEEAIKPLGSRSEEYILHVPSDGSTATLSANSTLGLLRGLTTFEQLWYDLDGAATYTLEAPIAITDSPAYVSVFALLHVHYLIMSLPLALPWIYARYCTKLVGMFSIAQRTVFDNRHSFPVSDIQRTLDAMSWAKVCTGGIYGLVHNI